MPAVSCCRFSLCIKELCRKFAERYPYEYSNRRFLASVCQKSFRSCLSGGSQRRVSRSSCRSSRSQKSTKRGKFRQTSGLIVDPLFPNPHALKITVPGIRPIFRSKSELFRRSTAQMRATFCERPQLDNRRHPSFRCLPHRDSGLRTQTSKPL